MTNGQETATGTPCWVRWQDQTLPGHWIRTVERGKSRGMYVVRIRGKERRVNPDAVTFPNERVDYNRRRRVSRSVAAR